MRRTQRALHLAAGLLLLALAAPATAGDDLDAEAKTLLQHVRKDRGPGVWLSAVRTLKAGSEAERNALAKALQGLLDRRLPGLKREVAALDALAAQIGDGEAAKKRVAAWDAARKKAVRWVYDPVTFPAPEGGRVNGPEQGSAEARTRCLEAIAAYAQLSRRLDRAVGRALDLSAPQADALLVDYAIAWMDVQAVVDEMRGLVEAPERLPEPDALALLLLDARFGRFATVAAAYEGATDEWLKLCLFHAYGRAILRWNEEHACGMGAAAVEAIRGVNEVRLALGVSPVAHNRKLARTAQTHTAEMVALDYWGHRSPNPERRTSTMRAALEGYQGEVTECLALTEDPRRALEIWYWDGAHFRGLVHPHWIECGLSDEKPVTWNAGTGEGRTPPGIRWRFPERFEKER